MRRALVALAMIVVVCGAIAAAPKARKPKTHTVIMEAMVYQPVSLTIRSGDTVVWVNKDAVAHTATAKGVFDSKLIPPGGSWKHTIRTKGNLPYVCTYHPPMKGLLRVE